MKKLYLLVDDSVKNGDYIKNCSIDIKKLYTNNTFIESTIENCDLCIYFLDDPLPDNFPIILEKLHNKKIIFIFCGDTIGCFDKILLNLTNVIKIGEHSSFVDLDLYKQPTLNKSYKIYLSTGINNSYHQNLKVIHTEKIECMIRSYFRTLDNSNNILLKDRSIDIACLGTINYLNDTNPVIQTNNKDKPYDHAGESRRKGMNVVNELKDKYKVIIGRYPYDEYINIAKNVKIFVSMQGLGETRWPGDLELAQLGCIIIKNCEYKIKSCPDIFNNIIYCNYNFDNLKEIINNIIENIDFYQDIVYKIQSKITKFDESEHINKLSTSILNSYNKYKINHIKYDNIHIYKQELLNSYDIQNNNLVFNLINNIDKKVFNSFGFLPITDYYIYHTYKCFKNKRFKCSIKFISNQDEIRYYDGNNWNKLISENKTFEINYENDFSKYIKTRVGFCFKNDMKIIEIKELDYKIDII